MSSNFKIYDPVAQLIATSGDPASILDPVLVSQGGTGTTTLTGYVKGNGTTPLVGSTTIPTTDLTGQFVGSVNGIAPVPTSGGNVTVLMGNVTTGTLVARPGIPGTNGNIYVVSGDSTPANNGRTYISDGVNWQEVTTNQAATDARYVLKAGDTITGQLLQPIAPSTGNALTNKTYVDSLVESGAPDATTSIAGKVQLAGDLGGIGTISTAPIITSGAVSNFKLSAGSNSTLKGTNGSGVVSDIVLGPGLTMPTGVLNLDPTNIQKAAADQFGVVQFDTTLGDLNPTSANSGIGVVKANAITTAKIANANVTNPKVNPGGANTLKGTNSLTNVDDIVLGSGLSLTVGAGPVLSVNQAAFNKAGATQFGMVEFDPSGDLNATFTNSGIGVIKPLAITNAKLANTTGNGQLKGSSQGSSAVTDLTIGTGLLLTGSTLNVTAGVLNVVQSTTVYTIPAAGSPSVPVSMTDYTINVNPGQGVKINYSWNYQSSGGGTAYAPSFGWSGTSVSDTFQSHIPGFFQGGASPLCTAIFQSTPPTQYTLSTTNADSNLNQNFTLTTGGLYTPAVAIYCNVYYKNNGGSSTSLTPIFNRDNKTATGVTIQIAGGWMDYTYF